MQLRKPAWLRLRKPTWRGALARIATDKKLPVAALMALALTASFQTFASSAGGTLEVLAVKESGKELVGGLANAPLEYTCVTAKGRVVGEGSVKTDTTGRFAFKLATAQRAQCEVTMKDARALVGTATRTTAVEAAKTSQLKFVFSIK